LILKQYYLACLAHASYLIADEAAGQAAVIDPQRDVEQYLEDAHRLSCRIGHVFLTHFHADFIAGHLELRDQTGAEIHLGARASAEYQFTPMGDGAEVNLGAVRLAVIETPGHSPESISLLVYDTEEDDETPYAVLTGDTLFIGDVGRPDLCASLGWGAEELASLLYDSVHEKLAALSRGRFTELVTSDQPEGPPYFSYDAQLNTREHLTLDASLERQLKPLSLDEVLELVDREAQTVGLA
jgi:hydroxyacylglutathione hydrolase